LIDKTVLSKYDKSGMYKVYDMWPEISRNAYNANYESVNFTNVDNIVFSGMGGSGAIGDIFAAILSKSNIHVSVVKGYNLPSTVNKNSLVVTTSVSGDTIETLSVLENAKKIGCNLIGFSSGGKMEKYCKNNNIEFRKIKEIHSPRASFPNFLYAILKILKPIIPIEEENIIDSINALEITKKKNSSENLNSKNTALSLAKNMNGIPLIYYPFGLQASAIRFKNCLQENSKIHAIVEDVVEACHNGIVSWEKDSIVQPILIEGTDDFLKTKERWEIIKDYFNINEIKYQEIFSVDGNILSKLINLIYVLDYSSIFHAVISQIDPSPVKSIDFVKSKL
jgi:glucose/mannose-6-phosphate isomerase